MTQPPDTSPPPAGEPGAAPPPPVDRPPAEPAATPPPAEPAETPTVPAETAADPVVAETPAEPVVAGPGLPEWAPPAVPEVPPPMPRAPGSPYAPTHARRRHRGTVLAVVALVAALLLCAGGGAAAYLRLRHTGGEGAADPVAAVEDFLRTVYVDRDPARAAALVCAEARDEPALAEKIREIDAYAGTLARPLFRWRVELMTETEQVADVSVTITITTRDEKIASQRLSVTVLHKVGWWVCDVDAEDPSAPADPTPAPTPAAPSP